MRRTGKSRKSSAKDERPNKASMRKEARPRSLGLPCEDIQEVEVYVTPMAATAGRDTISFHISVLNPSPRTVTVEVFHTSQLIFDDSQIQRQDSEADHMYWYDYRDSIYVLGISPHPFLRRFTSLSHWKRLPVSLGRSWVVLDRAGLSWMEKDSYAYTRYRYGSLRTCIYS